MDDKSIANKSLNEERKAIRSYTKRLRVAKSPKLRKAIRHALPEEKTHAALFMEAIRSARR